MTHILMLLSSLPDRSIPTFLFDKGLLSFHTYFKEQLHSSPLSPAFGKLTVPSFSAPISLWSQYLWSPWAEQSAYTSEVNQWIKDWILPPISSPWCSGTDPGNLFAFIILLCTTAVTLRMAYSLLARLTTPLLDCGRNDTTTVLQMEIIYARRMYMFIFIDNQFFPNQVKI